MFWAILSLNQVIGNSIITFVLGLITPTIFFLVLTVLGCTYFIMPVFSSFLFLFISKIKIKKKKDKKNKNLPKITLSNKINSIFGLFKNRKSLRFLVYLSILGVNIGFYNTYLYEIIAQTLPGQSRD